MIENYHGKRFSITTMYNGMKVIGDKMEQKSILYNFPQSEDVCDFLNAIWEKNIEEKSIEVQN